MDQCIARSSSSRQADAADIVAGCFQCDAAKVTVSQSVAPGDWTQAPEGTRDTSHSDKVAQCLQDIVMIPRGAKWGRECSPRHYRRHCSLG